MMYSYSVCLATCRYRWQCCLAMRSCMSQTRTTNATQTAVDVFCCALPFWCSRKQVQHWHNVFPMVLTQLCWHLANEYETNVANGRRRLTNAMKDDGSRPEKKHFGTHGWTPGAINLHQNAKCSVVSGTDFRLCANFQPNLFSSFGGDACQTDRQNDRQNDKITNSKLNIHY